MIKKAILAIILIIIQIIALPVIADEYTSIQQEQNELSYLKKENLTDIVLFSEYDLYYDTNLDYNKSVKDIIEKFSKAEGLYQKSNVSAAYREYKNTLETMQKNDFYYMMTAYKLTEIGFYSLAYQAMMKVEDKEIWGEHINFIRKHFFPNVDLKVPEEVFFAGLLSDIKYQYLTDESIAQLDKDGNIFNKSDYADYIRAKAYFIDKKYKQALIHINEAISKNSESIVYKELKAEVLNALNRENETLGVIRQIESKNIVSVIIQKDLEKIKYYALSKAEKKEFKQKYYLAYYFYLNKDYERAINELKMLILKGENKFSPEILGHIYKVTERYNEAKKLYEKILLNNKKCAYAHKGLGDIYLIEKKYSGALYEYKLANKYLSHNKDILTALTVVSSKLGDKKLAEKYLNQLTRLKPLNYKTIYLKSKLKEDNGRLNLKESISSNPFYYGGWLDLVQTALEMNDINSAEEYINTAAFITKNSARYFYYKSIINTNKGNLKTAQKDIKKAKEIIKEQAVKYSGKEDEQL